MDPTRKAATTEGADMNPVDDDDTTLESRFRSAAATIPAHGDVNDVLHGRDVSVRATASSRPNRHFVSRPAPTSSCRFAE